MKLNDNKYVNVCLCASVGWSHKRYPTLVSMLIGNECGDLLNYSENIRGNKKCSIRRG